MRLEFDEALPDEHGRRLLAVLFARLRPRRRRRETFAQFPQGRAEERRLSSVVCDFGLAEIMKAERLERRFGPDRMRPHAETAAARLPIEESYGALFRRPNHTYAVTGSAFALRAGIVSFARYRS